MRVGVTVEEIEMDAEDGISVVPGVRVTCNRCQHSVAIYGTEQVSITRGCATLHEECPQRENNYYDPNYVPRYYDDWRPLDEHGVPIYDPRYDCRPPRKKRRKRKAA
jgi:hypothetical protein